MNASVSALSQIAEVARTYGEAVYYARAEVFQNLCHEHFQMTLIENGQASFWNKTTYLERVRGRKPFAGDASYEILGIDVAGDEMARVHLWVDVPPYRYEDHLGFVRQDGGWKLLTKVFRTAGRLDEQE